MVYERFLSQEVEDFSGWRCVACGEIYNYPQFFYQTSDMVAHEGLYARLKKEA